MECLKLIRTCLALFLAVALAGCATMTPDECRVADWYLIGELDARSGRTPAHFSSRAQDCAEAGYPADQASWREGWEHGLTVFCTAAQGFRFGRDGNRYEPICPAALEPEFLAGYDLGRSVHDASARVDDLSRQLEALDREFRETARNGNLTEDQKDDFESRQRALRRQLRNAELELAELNGLARGRGFY